MGLFDDLFGKETINQLRDQLAEKTQELAQATSKIAVETSARFELEIQLSGAKTTITVRDAFIESLKSARDKKFEALRVAALEQRTRDEKTISNLKASLAETSAEKLAAIATKDSIEKDWRESTESNDAKCRTYLEREKSLAAKSEKLLLEQQKIDQLAVDLRAREQHWKQAIEPQLLKYEEHLSIDKRELELREISSQIEQHRAALKSREADLIQRSASDKALKARETEVIRQEKLLVVLKSELDLKSHALNSQKSLQEARANKLEDWARELSSFQNRINQLDAEFEKLAEESNRIRASEEIRRSQHLERLAELRRQNTALKGVQNNLEQQELHLKTREKEIKREESQIARIKNRNLELREEQKQLTSLTASLEVSNRKSISEIKRLTKKYEALQVGYDNLQESLKNTYDVHADNSSLINSKVLSWLLEYSGPDATNINNGWLGFTGQGPWHEQSLELCLEELTYQFYSMPDGDLEHVIVGRSGWSKTELIAQIEAREGQPLRIYSQEMFFAKLATGKDPFDSDDEELLEAFAEDHPALQFLMSLPEPWPTVTFEESESIVEIDGEDFGVSESPLRILGYRVGATSDLSATERRKILTECLASRELTFSEDSDEGYIAKWGRGGGAQRLYRMAVHIKSLADGRVGKDYRKPQARKEWIEDLKWLKDKYFAKYKTRFLWPGV